MLAAFNSQCVLACLSPALQIDLQVRYCRCVSNHSILLDIRLYLDEKFNSFKILFIQNLIFKINRMLTPHCNSIILLLHISKIKYVELCLTLLSINNEYKLVSTKMSKQTAYRGWRTKLSICARYFVWSGTKMGHTSKLNEFGNEFA